MITVEVGTDKAIEAWRDPLSEDPEALHYRLLKGERVVHLLVPPEQSYLEAVQNCDTAIRQHLDRDATPLWIECSEPHLHEALLSKFGLSLESGAQRPVDWGRKAS